MYFCIFLEWLLRYKYSIFFKFVCQSKKPCIGSLSLSAKFKRSWKSRNTWCTKFKNCIHLKINTFALLIFIVISLSFIITFRIQRQENIQCHEEKWKWHSIVLTFSFTLSDETCLSEWLDWFNLKRNVSKNTVHCVWRIFWGRVELLKMSNQKRS